MSAFAVQLDALLLDLRSLPSPSQSPRQAPVQHIQHAAIRLERAYAELKHAGTHAPATLFIRLRNRLDELAAALDDAHSASESPSWDKLAKDTRQVVTSVDDLLATSTSTAAPTPTSSHSRTPSADLPRRLPAQQPAPANASPAADLDAFLSTAAGKPPPTTANGASPLAAARARALSELHTLFQLSTSPSSVLLPGQSLRSIFRSSLPPPDAAVAAPSEPTSLEDRISSQLHRAYFDSFAATLSSSSSSSASTAEQHAAWTRLAQDLRDAVLPLVPSRLKTPGGSQPLRAHLEATLRASAASGGATAFDARAALKAVRECVDALGRLCAPARDDAVRSLADEIDRALAGPASDSSSALVDLVRRTLKVARGMERDVRRFRAGAVVHLASEAELSGVVREEAGARERALVEGWCGGADGVRRETRGWCARALGRAQSDSEGAGDAGASKEDVAAALVETLFSDKAVALPPFASSDSSAPHDDASSDPAPPPPPPPGNLLPAILLAPSATLFELQNRLQALTILACLLILSPSADPARLWALLESEVAPPTAPPPGANGEEAAPRDPVSEPSPTRIAHLADELLPRAGPSPPPAKADADADAEARRLRAAVERVLRYEDPVWRLLHGRLRDAVKGAVVGAVRGDAAQALTEGQEREQPAVPPQLRTGRTLRGTPAVAARATRGARDDEAQQAAARRRVVDLPPVKGFDAPLLRDELRRTVQDRVVGDVWGWVEEVWGEVLGWRGEEHGAGRECAAEA